MSTRDLARCKGFDFAIEDHGLPVLYGHFEYEGSGGQGFGYMVDAAFLMRFMGVFGVERLQQVNGRSCWVTHTSDRITLIEPLHASDGQPFDIGAWEAWVKRRAPFSAYELRTGEEPKR